MTCRLCKGIVMKTGKRTFIIIFCIYMAAVAAVCFLRPDNLPDLKTDNWLGIPVDKLLHFLMFLPFPILSGAAFIHADRAVTRQLLCLILLGIIGAATAYGTEIIQGETGYRSYEIADFYADITGIATGIIISAGYMIINRRKR